MMGNEGISVADALALRGSGYSDGGGFGNGSDAWWIIILVLLFGWGRNGSFGGGGEGYGACCTPATMQGMTDAFNFNQLDNGLRGIEQGICNGFYTSAQQINSVLSALQDCCCKTQTSMLTGFHGIESALCSMGYQNQAGFNNLSNQLASCCCDIERGQDGLRYNLANATSQLIVAGDKNTDRIISYLEQNEKDKLRTELQSAQFQLSQLSQTDNIFNRLMPVAKPAYLTCSPYASAFGLNQNFGFGFNNGCGCC